QLPARIALLQPRRAVLHHHQHRALGSEALVANVGGHGADVAGLHHDAAARGAAVLVGDLPVNLVGQLDEPLVAVVAVDHRQHVLLAGDATDAGAADRGEAGVPGPVGAGDVVEQV